MNSIAETIQSHALAQPDKVAVIAEDRTVNYSQLWTLIKAAAQGLTQKGVKPGDRVVVESAHTVEFVACCYGIHLAGGVHVPIENHCPATRSGEIAAELSASLLLCGDRPLHAIGVSMDDPAQVSDETIVFPGRDTLAEILFTTGTTGKSKGVMVTHDAQMNMAQSCNAVLDYAADNLWLIPTPMNHAAGLRKTHMSMVKGSAVLLLSGFTDLRKLFDKLDGYPVTSIYLPPSAVQYILSLVPDAFEKYSGQLDFLYSSAAAMPQVVKETLRAQLPDTRMFDAYGGSETGAVCYMDFNKMIDKQGAVGKPNPGVEIFITDENHRVIQSSADNPGIIAIKSNTLMAGYWGEPELTAATLQNGVIYMSDMGYIGEDGYLYLKGRLGDVINVGGYKVAPIEVEDAALRLPMIAACACVPYTGRGSGLCVKLFVCLKDGYTFDKKEIASRLGDVLEAYKVPKFYEQIDAIPMTYNGKIDRKKLMNRQ